MLIFCLYAIVIKSSLVNSEELLWNKKKKKTTTRLDKDSLWWVEHCFKLTNMNASRRCEFPEFTGVWRLCVCVCARVRGWGGVNHPREKKGKTYKQKRSKGPFHMFSIEIWWIFCHRAFEVIAEHTVQRNARLGHCFPSLCCHLHCALLTLCFSKEQHPTPPINASLGPMLAVSRGGEHVSRLFSHNSHTLTSTKGGEIIKKPPPSKKKNLGTV